MIPDLTMLDNEKLHKDKFAGLFHFFQNRRIPVIPQRIVGQAIISVGRKTDTLQIMCHTGHLRILFPDLLLYLRILLGKTFHTLRLGDNFFIQDMCTGLQLDKQI